MFVLTKKAHFCSNAHTVTNSETEQTTELYLVFKRCPETTGSSFPGSLLYLTTYLAHCLNKAAFELCCFQGRREHTLITT